MNGQNANPALKCDLAILTVIEIEHRQVLKAFGITNYKPKVVNRRSYWETSLFSQNTQQPLQIVIGSVSRAGLVHAALRTVRFLTDYNPTMLVLVGIAAGCREKLRIGDVVWPRNILNTSISEEHEGGDNQVRPDHHKPSGEVTEMMQTWEVNGNHLGELITTILGKVIEIDPAWKDSRGDEVLPKPVVNETVIACGNVLVRNSQAFPKLRKLDPQVRAFEMESAGMVSAIEDSGRGTAWLQIRGISDFGDRKKDDLWQPYAAATAAAFVRLFAEFGFNPELITGIASPTAETAFVSPSTTSGASQQGSVVMSQPSEKAPTDHPVALEFNRLRDRWRKTRDSDVITKLLTLCNSPEFAAAPPSARIAALRFVGRLILEVFHDREGAQILIGKAEQLGGPSRLMQSLLVDGKDPLAAARILEPPQSLEEWNQYLIFLLQGKQIDKLLETLDKPPIGIMPDVESLRIRILALIVKKRIADAVKAFATIHPEKRELFAIRLTGAILDYYSAISPAAPEGAFQLTPAAVVQEFIQRDDESIKALSRAEGELKSLIMNLQKKDDMYFELKHWQLAALVNQPLRRSEAENLCLELLEENPGDPFVMALAYIHKLPTDQDSNIAALAAKLDLKI